jgi:hypothetical protein
LRELDRIRQDWQDPLRKLDRIRQDWQDPQDPLRELDRIRQDWQDRQEKTGCGILRKPALPGHDVPWSTTTS